MSRTTRRVEALQERVNDLEDSIVKFGSLMVRLGEQVVAMEGVSVKQTKLVETLIEGIASAKELGR